MHSAVCPSGRVASGPAGRVSPWAFYLLAATLAAALRIPLAFFNYYAGYVEENTALINIDGIGYVRKAAGAQESYGDLNWLYDGINSVMLWVGGSEHALYLQMSLLNVVLSLLLPLAAWPSFSALTSDSVGRARARCLGIVVLLFWPPAIWISAQNMKDTLLALLIAAFVSLAVLVLQRRRYSKLTVVFLIVVIWLILSLRVYAAAILGLAFAIALLASWRQHRALLCVGAIVATIASFGPLRATIDTVLRPENRFLFDPEIVNAINEQRIGESENFIQINATVPDIARDALRAPLNPFPSARWHNANDGLLMLRTVIVALSLGGFLTWLALWRSPSKPFFVSALALSWLFFAVGRSYSGPRQIYSTVEPVMLIAASVAVAESGRATAWRWSAIAGTVVLVVLLIYTSLADFAFVGPGKW
jgi:hypothetical protein